MATFFVNNVKMHPSNLWYHYKEKFNSDNTFEVIISKAESEVIKTIEDYCLCRLESPEIDEIIMKLDLSKRSLGLMWHILNHARGVDSKLNTYDWEWVVNNITEIKIDKDFLIIKGEVSEYRET